MVQISEFAFLDDTLSRDASSKVTSCNNNMRRYPSKCVISSKRADIE